MSVQAIDFGAVDVLTFDCYGTLIDWERGLLQTLRRSLGSDRIDDALLAAYAAEEASLEAGQWRPYRDIVRAGLTAVCQRFGHDPGSAEMTGFADSPAHWPAFPDSADALAALATHLELGVLTNCDDDLFDASNELLGRPFSWAITAEQVQSYKPSMRHFEAALERIGERRGSWVHVAQSLYHDHAPARSLGLQTVWINRRHGRSGSGATPASVVQPTLEMRDMVTFARVAMDVRG